jgi:DNA-binding response OmpR family regulator
MSSRTTPVVLVADDEPSMLALVSRHVKTLGYEVLEASDGETAWGHASRRLPDLVVLDVMMPGMSGWEVCRRIRENVALAHTGVIMLTGIGQSLNELTSPLYGADAYIDKPFEFKELDEKIRSVLSDRGHASLEPLGVGDDGDEPDGDDDEAANDAAERAKPVSPAQDRRPATQHGRAHGRAHEPEEEAFYAAVTLRPPPPAPSAHSKGDAAKSETALGVGRPAKKPAKKPAAKAAKKPAAKASKKPAKKPAAKASKKPAAKASKKPAKKPAAKAAKKPAKKPAAKAARKPTKKPAAKAAKKSAKKPAAKAATKPAKRPASSKSR